MSRVIQATVPEPYAEVFSLRNSVMALKELVEVMAGQRGASSERAVTVADLEDMASKLVRASKGGEWNSLPYVNSWADYGSPYAPCGFRKMPTGLVIMRGLCQGGTAATICTLPVGYRPSIQLLMGAQTSPNVMCRLDITTGGVLTHTGGSNGWISLNNICFLAEN